MTLNTQSRVSLNMHNRTAVNEVVTLEIDKNGNVSRALPDPSMKSMTLENTLLRQLYPGIQVATVNVPTDPLDAWEETQVETAMANLVLDGVRYKFAVASGSAKKGKFYFGDYDDSERLAKRFRHKPQGGIVYFRVLRSDCRVGMGRPDGRVRV